MSLCQLFALLRKACPYREGIITVRRNAEPERDGGGQGCLRG